MRVFETVHGVFLDDLDAIGVLHNTRYLLMFERALGAFWRHLGWRKLVDYQANPDGLQVVRENRVEYLRPVAGADEVRVRTWVGGIGRTSLTFRFLMLPVEGDTPFAAGTRVMVKIDADTRRPSPWTAAFKEMMAPWCDVAVPGGGAGGDDQGRGEAARGGSGHSGAGHAGSAGDDIIVERPRATPCPSIH